MRKISTLFSLTAALSLVIIPTQAQADVSRERVEAVYTSALQLCPSAYASGPGGAGRMVEFAERQGYTDEEKILLLNLCLMFGKGISKGLDLATQK